MDVFTHGAGGPTPRPLGRDTTTTIATKDEWQALIAEAPHIFSGTSSAVQVSPPIWQYCIGGFDNQWVGMCVGKATKNAAGTLLRIPPGAVYDPDGPGKGTPPLTNLRLSGLYSYILARRKSMALGLRMGGAANDPNGGGAVVAHAMLALLEHGVVLDATYADTQANQLHCTDRSDPPGVADGAKHRPAHAVRITSRQQYFDYLTQGIPIVDGLQIGEGWMDTDDDGKFSLDGKVVGGHATMTAQFDRRLNRLYKRNSWFKWGARTASPEFNSGDPAYGGNAEGYSNIGHCALDQFEERYLTDAKFRSGETDAFALLDSPDGFPRPKISPRSNVSVFA